MKTFPRWWLLPFKEAGNTGDLLQAIKHFFGDIFLRKIYFTADLTILY